MNVNDLQRRIAIIENKFRMLDINQFYDSDYNYMIKFNNLEKKICFILNREDLEHIKNSNDDSLIICLSEELKDECLDMIYETNLDFLISIREYVSIGTFIKIIEYLFYKKTNNSFLDIIGDILKGNKVGVNNNKESLSNSLLGNLIGDKVDNIAEINSNIINILNNELKKDAPFKKKKAKKYFLSDNRKTAVLAMTSKRYSSISYKYWFTFHKYQKDYLEQFENSYVMLYFVDKAECVIIDTNKLYSYLDKLNKTVHGDNIGWHLHVQEKDGIYQLRIPKEGTVSLKDEDIEEKEYPNIPDVKPDNTIKLSLNDYKVVRIKK